MVEYYRRGSWIVGTPVYPLPEDDLAARIQAMACPHPEYQEVERRTEDVEGQGKHLVIVERCPLCPAIRWRMLPVAGPQESFDPSMPMEGPWFERLYNFGSFTLLARRHQQPGMVMFLTRVETPSGKVHSGFVPLEMPLFSAAALELISDLERVLKLGPDRYVSYRSFRESGVKKSDLKTHVSTLFPVAQEIGPEGVASAKATIEQEIESEIVEFQEQAAAEMEEQARELREQAAKKKKRKEKV